MIRRLIVLLCALFFATAAYAGIHFHGQAVSNACTGQPAGVVGNGLCPIALLKSTNGARTATVNVSVYPSLPAGFTYTATTPFNSNITGTGTNVTGIDNVGRGGFYYVGTGTHTLTDFSLTSNSQALSVGGFPLGTGVTSGATITGNPNVDLEHGTVDGSGMQNGVSTMVNTHGAGAFKAAFVNFLHPARDPFVTNAVGSNVATWVIDHDYFDAYCQNTTGTDHCENMHFQAGGTAIVTSNYSNASDGTITGGNSAVIQAQTGVGSDFAAYADGPLTLNVAGNVFNYGCIVNQAEYSLKAVFADITANIGAQNGLPGNVWCTAATAPATIIVTQADIGITSVVGTFANNDTLTAAGGKSATLLCSPAPTCVSNLHLATWGTGAHFVAGDAITGSPSGATAVATSAISYHNVTVNNLGGNVDFSNNPVSP